MAGAVMVRSRGGASRLCATADRRPARRPREAFARDFSARAYADVAETRRRSGGGGGLRGDPASVPCTPRHSRRRTRQAHHSGKPMALTLADCDAIIAAAERNKTHLIVGHTHAYDPTIRVMRKLISSGALGRLGMIHSFNYTNFLYRPRRPERTRHAGRRRHSVQPAAASDRHRAPPGRRPGSKVCARKQACSTPPRPTEELRRFPAIRERRCGLHWSTAATIISIPTNGISGSPNAARRRSPPMAPRAACAAPIQRRSGVRAPKHIAYGKARAGLPPHQPHFGLTIATCASGDLRASANGLTHI